MAELVLPVASFGNLQVLTFRLRIGSGVAEVAVIISHDGHGFAIWQGDFHGAAKLSFTADGGTALVITGDLHLCGCSRCRGVSRKRSNRGRTGVPVASLATTETSPLGCGSAVGVAEVAILISHNFCGCAIRQGDFHGAASFSFTADRWHGPGHHW